MRLIPYKTVDDVLDDLTEVLAHHYGAMPLYWGYSKNEALKCVASDFVDSVNLIAHAVEPNAIISYPITPSQIAKTAFRASVTSKMLDDVDRDLFAESFLSFFNMSVAMRNHYVSNYHSSIPNIDFEEADSKDKQRLVSLLNATIRAYCELIYCDEHTISGEISGPYKMNAGNMIIRDFHLLCPNEIHPVLCEFNIEKIRTFCVYDSTDLFVDLFGNIPSKSINMTNDLLLYSIEVTYTNGLIKTHNDIDSLQGLINYLHLWISNISQEYSKQGDFYLWVSTVLCEFYAMKPLLVTLGKEWDFIRARLDRPLFESVKESLERKSLEVNKGGLDEAYYMRLRKRLDPRVGRQ